VLLRIEGHRPADTAGARAGKRGLDRPGSAEELTTGGQIEGVQPLDVLAAAVFDIAMT
jgi:hypothetical protein